MRIGQRLQERVHFGRSSEMCTVVSTPLEFRRTSSFWWVVLWRPRSSATRLRSDLSPFTECRDKHVNERWSVSPWTTQHKQTILFFAQLSLPAERKLFKNHKVARSAPLCSTLRPEVERGPKGRPQSYCQQAHLTSCTNKHCSHFVQPRLLATTKRDMTSVERRTRISQATPRGRRLSVRTQMTNCVSQLH